MLHISKDGEYYFVKTYNYDGWGKVSDITLTNKSEWEIYGNTKDFLILIGNKIQLDFNLFNKKVSELCLTMETKLSLLANDNPAFVDHVLTIYVMKKGP